MTIQPQGHRLEPLGPISPPSRTLAAKKRKSTDKASGRSTASSEPRRSAPRKRGDEPQDDGDGDGDEHELDESDDEGGEPSDEDDEAEIIEVSGAVVEDADEVDLTDDFDDSAGYEVDDDRVSDPDAGDRSSTAITVARSRQSLVSRDALQAYMREVQSHSLLTPDEERELAVRYAETQDVDAAARLVTANLRLVVKLAYEYRRAYRNMMDLIQEGNMGLMQAVKKYDPYRGVKLSSYAAWWIRAYMLRYILANWRMVKLGTTQAQRKLFFNLNKEKARLSALGIEPTNEEIATRLDVTEKEVEEMDKRLARNDASLDTPVNEADGRQIARVELLPAPGEQPDMVTEGAELSQLLREHLSEFRKGLSGKDLIIFDERLVADEPRTLQDLGDQFGVSRERVRQLESRMTGKLRQYLSERIGDPITIA